MPDNIVGLLVALGSGLLIGIERERRKGAGDDRQAAGLRSFVASALTGALAQSLHAQAPGLVVIGALLIVLLVATAYWKSRSRDPGLTTEVALLTTYLIGVHAVISPALAAACGAGLALLLAARARLHRLATELLSEQELHDGLLLAALALIALPLVPTQPIEALGGMRLRPLVALVLLIMGMQAAGQVALRWLGPKHGLLASGFISGFVSSTASVASLGSRARATNGAAPALAGAAVLSAAATWFQAVVISAALSPEAALALLPMAAMGAGSCAAAGSWMVLRAGAAQVLPLDADTAPSQASALRPREALIVAAVLAAVAAGVGMLQRRFGEAGLGLGVALAGLGDAHAPIASLAALHAAGSLATPSWVAFVLLAIAANSATRCVVAAVAGGQGFGLLVGLALIGSLLAAGGLAWVMAEVGR